LWQLAHVTFFWKKVVTAAYLRFAELSAQMQAHAGKTVEALENIIRVAVLLWRLIRLK
jgi:hypothetical protein